MTSPPLQQFLKVIRTRSCEPAAADSGFDDDVVLCQDHDQEQSDADRRVRPLTPEMLKAAEWLERMKGRKAGAGSESISAVAL
jgi:hypothetical protein